MKFNTRELSGFLESLEDLETSGNGFGTLRSAVVETELSGQYYHATYDGAWTLHDGPYRGSN